MFRKAQSLSRVKTTEMTREIRMATYGRQLGRKAVFGQAVMPLCELNSLTLKSEAAARIYLNTTSPTG